MKKIIIMATAAVALTMSSCKEETKSIVVYYSQTGATEKVAKLFSEKTGADIELIEAVKPYDGDFDATIARCQEEMKNGELPEIKALKKNIAEYDTIYLGFPVWFGVAAPPMKAFLKDAELKGKVIVPFCTFGSGGLETSLEDMKDALAEATVTEGYCVRNARVGKASEEIDRFLITIGAKEGDVDELPEFSEQLPLTEEERTIYDEACGDYPMPLGMPVSVGSRTTAEFTEYLFTNKSEGPDGKENYSTIYVLGKPGETFEFTKVVR